VQVAREFLGGDKTAIISESEDVLRLAGSLGVCAIRQTREPGLNGAAAQGVDQLRARGAGAILVIASDLPLIRATDMYDIAAHGREQRVAICPDKHYTGTNAVFLSAGTSLAFHFGAGSFDKHCREAQRCGLAPIVHFNRRIAMDIDVPADLRTWLSAPTESPLLLQGRSSNALCDGVFPSWWNAAAGSPPSR
jgi:2-phospho-L-lactate guanylyltransferase